VHADASQVEKTAKRAKKAVQDAVTGADDDLPADPPPEAIAGEQEQDAMPAAPSAKSGSLKVGQPLPGDVVVTTDEGAEVSVTSLFADKGGVIFVYPKVRSRSRLHLPSATAHDEQANTPGCTKQACHFRDSYKAFEDAGFAVYGLSMDSPKSQTTWKTKVRSATGKSAGRPVRPLRTAIAALHPPLRPQATAPQAAWCLQERQLHLAQPLCHRKGCVAAIQLGLATVSGAGQGVAYWTRKSASSPMRR
jgi:hypothetical protein